MINIDIKSTNEFDFALTASKDQIEKAALRALNKTSRWLRSDLVSQTAKSLNIKSTPIRDVLVIVRAKKTNLKTTVGLSKRGGVIRAIDAGSATQNSKGVRVGKRQFDNAFLATMPSGHHGVFKRKGKERLPIKEVQIFISSKLHDLMEEASHGRALSHFETVFERELRYLRKAG